VPLQPVEQGVGEGPAAQCRVVLRHLAGCGGTQQELFDSAPGDPGEGGDRGSGLLVVVLQEGRTGVEEEDLLSEAPQVVPCEVLPQVRRVDAAFVLQ
jgi:hypothetical protein